MSQIRVAVPLVPLFILPEWGGAWSGKWSLNTSSETVCSMGGPWNTEADCVSAVLSTGKWELVPGMASPHFVPANS